MHRGKILIIDDNIEMGKTLSDILRDEIYLPSLAESGEQARDMLSRSNYHQAIVDVMLPDANGIVLISELQKLRPGLRCYTITAYPEPNMQTRALGVGALEFITKPLDISLLLNLLERNSGIPVLIVEDDRALGESLQSRLSSSGYRAYLASSWIEAKEMLNTVTPDRAIIDLKLPGKDGLRVMRALKKRFPWLESIVMTGFTEMEPLLEEALKEKALAGLHKPFLFKELLEILEKSFENEK